MTLPFQPSRDVIVRTEQFDDAARFYETVLGLPITHRTDSLVGFDAGAITLYLERGEPHGPVFDFRVPDVDAARASVTAAGCTLVEENPSIPRLYMHDPYGIVFNLEQ